MKQLMFFIVMVAAIWGRGQGRNINVTGVQAKIEEKLACESAKRGLTERVDVQNKLRQVRRQILIQALKDDMYKAIPQPTEIEMNAAYRQLMNNWRIPEAYQVDAVDVKLLDEKQKQLARGLVTGNAVDDKTMTPLLAKASATQRSGQWLAVNNFAPEIWKQLSQMKLNEVRLISTARGVFLIRKGRHRVAAIKALEAVRKQLKSHIQQQKFEKQWNQYLLQIQMSVLEMDK